MGGMFTTLKVREDQKPDDYSDPGWYKQPPGTQAYEYKGTTPPVSREQAAKVSPDNNNAQVRKPNSGSGGGHQH